jgi:hypothetical protein
VITQPAKSVLPTTRIGFHYRQEQGLLFRAVNVGQNYAKVGRIEITLTGMDVSLNFILF